MNIWFVWGWKSWKEPETPDIRPLSKETRQVTRLAKDYFLRQKGASRKEIKHMANLKKVKTIPPDN